MNQIAGKMESSCPLGTTRCIQQANFHQKPYNKSFIDQVCSVKMAGYWPRFFFCEFVDLDFVSVYKHAKKKNLANIQPSWPHTWSITHTYILIGRGIIILSMPSSYLMCTVGTAVVLGQYFPVWSWCSVSKRVVKRIDTTHSVALNARWMWHEWHLPC